LGTILSATGGAKALERALEEISDNRRKVLIVDDDHNILTLLSHWLESCGFAVRTCGGALDALHAATTQFFDYIVTDNDMPRMNGIQLVRLLRHRQPRAIIIGMSGKDMNVQFLDAGANDFVQKPFRPNDIVMMMGGVPR
jgi:CheY-like chemotaxis protein